MGIGEVIKSVVASSQNWPGLGTVYTVRWTGTDGIQAHHAAIPKTVMDVALPNQTVLLTELTSLPGDRNAKPIGHVLLEIQDGTAVAYVYVGGKRFPLGIEKQESAAA